MRLDETAVGILAKSVYRQLREYGCTRAQVIHLTSELLSLLSADVQKDRTAAPAATPEPQEGSPP